MKTLVPLIVGILLAMGVVKLSRPADPGPRLPVPSTPGEPTRPPTTLPDLGGAWSMAEGATRQDSAPLAALVTPASAAELSAGRRRLETRHPDKAQRRALFDRLRAAQTRSDPPSLETLDALLSGTGLEEEDLSDGVLLPMDWGGDFDELGAFDAVGLTREEGAALMSEGLRRGWF